MVRAKTNAQWLGICALLVGVAIPTLLFWVLVLSAPLDVLTRNPELAALCSSVQRRLKSWFPTIDFLRHARSTRFPEVAAMATAYVWAWWLWMTPCFAILSLVSHRVQRASHLEMGVRSVLWMVFVAPWFGLLCLYVFFALPGDPGRYQGFTTHSRLGYAFMATMAVCLSSFSLGALPVSLTSLFADIVFSGGK